MKKFISNLYCRAQGSPYPVENKFIDENNFIDNPTSHISF
tara:strand:- start:1404 stop:1523 length:120 start_codon:yes stop_codon:yes gene_type:complete